MGVAGFSGRKQGILTPYSNEPQERDGEARVRGPVAGPLFQRLAAVTEDGGNTMVLMTIASVFLSTIVAVKFLSPLFHTLAILPFFYATMREHSHQRSLTLVIRWALALLVTTIAIGAFVPGRVVESLPFAERTALAIEGWLIHDAAPPASYGYILWGTAVFVVATGASGGILAFILGSIALTGAASGALFLFENGVNIVQVAVIAIPIWQWSLFAACASLLVPAALPVFEFLFKAERVMEERRILLNYIYVGAGLFLLAVLLRLATADIWRQAVLRWTIF